MNLTPEQQIEYDRIVQFVESEPVVYALAQRYHTPGFSATGSQFLIPAALLLLSWRNSRLTHGSSMDTPQNHL